ncbi:MAG: site-specific integrase [Deltaproteobacteria bacterium]|nr:site-specific integrase [Deltaproteobacteria bacterium]
MPLYQDKRTNKWVIQYPVGYKYVPDKKNPGQMVKANKIKTEVIGISKKLAQKTLIQREAHWEQTKFDDEFIERPAKTKYSLKELIDWYLALPVVKKKRSYDKDKERSKYLLEHFGEILAEKIKPSMIEIFQSEMLKKVSYRGRTYQPATVNRAVALLKRIINLAIREDMIVKNPCWKVAQLAEENKRDRILNPEEYSKLVSELPRHLVPILQVGYQTGMRLNEILGLTWDRVNMKDGYLDLEAENTKTREPRRIYFNETIKNVFIDAGKIRGIGLNQVFIRKGRPIKSVRKGLEGAMKRSGIEEFTFHDLRHTYVTNARKAGVSDSVIMKLTGHKTMAMFTRYNTIDQADAIEAAEKVQGFLTLSDKENLENFTDHLQTAKLRQKKRSQP